MPQENGDRVRVAYMVRDGDVSPAAQQHRPAQPALPEGPGRFPASPGREGDAELGHERCVQNLQ